MPARKPRIEYRWRARQWGATTTHEVTWSMYGANGEYMCGSGSEGFPGGKTDARRSVRAVMTLCGCEPLASVNMYFREVGPGPKPK